MVTPLGESQADHLKIKRLSKIDNRFFLYIHYILLRLWDQRKKGARKDTVEYPNRTPFPKKRLGGTIVGKWLTFDVICLYSIYLIFSD